MREFHKNLVPTKEWICFYCVDYLDDSKSVHHMKQMESRNFAKHTRAQTIIAKYVRRFIAQSFFIKIYNLIVYIQVRFRVNKRKQAFHKQVQSKLRPYNIRIVKCSDLNLDAEKRVQGLRNRRGSLPAADSTSHQASSSSSEEAIDYVYVVVTVLDVTKGQLQQSWRVASELIPLDDAHFAAPGQHHKAEVTPLGQPHFFTHRVAHYQAPSHKHLHMDCNFLLGGVSGYNYVVLSLFQRGAFSRDVMLGQAYLDLSLNMTWKRGGVFVKNLEEQDFAVKDHMGMDLKTDHRSRPQGSIEFELSPVQGLCSGCGIVYAPCAEDLVRIVSLGNRFSGFTLPAPSTGAAERRKYTNGLSNPGYGAGSSALHLKKSWIAIADGRIYMYSHFGDSLKLRINVEHFNFYATVRNKNVVYILRTPDYPDLEFYTINKEEELRWKCAFLSSFRYKHSGTMVVSGGETYDMRGLIKDLSLLEVTRYGNKDSPVMHFYSSTASNAHASSKYSSSKVTAAAVAATSAVSGTAAAAAAGTIGKGPTAVLQPVKEVEAAVKKKVSLSEAPPSISPSLSVHTSSAFNSPDAKSTEKKTLTLPALSPTPTSSASPGNNNAGHILGSPSAATAGATPAKNSGVAKMASIRESPVPALKSADSISSIASSHAGSEGGQNSSSSGASSPVPPNNPRHRSTIATTTIGRRKSMLGNSLASLSLDDSDVGGKKKNKAEKGVFDEIDQEIANIQAVKAKYKKEAKEYKEERRKRAVAEGSAHNHAHNSAHSNMYSTSSIGSNASSHGSSHGTSRDLAAVVTKAISLQSIKEAVSDIYEAEEGILNEKVNSVGARFVTNVLASLKQRKVKRPSHQTS